MAADVFISYRGADRVLARRLENRLRSRWGNRVFRDETGVKSGRNWAKELTDAMQEARVIIALIGPGWNISTDKDAEDWVRKELALAVEGGKPILPVLVGKSEELRPKLEAMPEAFRKQAVVVGPDLAGFDLHEIAVALGRLGASQSDGAWSLAARRGEMVPMRALVEGEQAIADGKSLLLVGSSGSGRHAMICRLVENLKAEGHLVASYGVGLGDGSRNTHAVISGWIQSLSETFLELTSPFATTRAGQALVRSILEAGPDLLSRKVVKAAALLPLGGTQHDQLILEAVRRPTDRWAPFPPTRLRNQSRAVIERLWESVTGNPKPSILGEDKKLILVVDHFDNVDSNSEELVKDLMMDPINDADSEVRFIIATYESGRTARSEIAWLEKMQADETIRRIDIDNQTDWGDHIKPWLAAHNVKLAESVEKCIKDEPNPYQALAKLWYLVDNGLVTEPPHPGPTGRSKKSQAQDGFKPVIWDMARSYLQAQRQQQPVPNELPREDGDPPEKALLTQDRLLDHMISEHVPVKFLRLVEAGALMGRTFSFYAAYAAANPPATEETVDEPLSVRERDKWLKDARDAWTDLKTIDPDRSVIRCSESDSGDLLVSLAQAHLIGHLRNQLSPRTARLYHQRLARYLMNPIEELDQDDYGDQYHRANLAAEHWSLAERPRDAADAHRNAAQLAELSLAYGESHNHYRSAIRLYTQLLAEGVDPTREHEDLLILANCFYRLGQTIRLSGNPHRVEKIDDEKWGAINYLDRARERLEELKVLLLKNEPNRWRDGITGPRIRGIPGPHLVRHHLRVYNAVSGHVHLELAQCLEAVVDECRAHSGEEIHTCEKCETDRRAIRDRLFDSLRHAEAAHGEAGSRWLLAAASARLAALLTDEALRVERDDKNRAGELAVEAFFHIERIIGLEPHTTEEKHEFADPVSVAWRSAGRLFRHRALNSRIAEWCFRKMNAHGDDVTTAVDMVTDRWLGGFLLSICEPGIECAQPGKPESTIDEAKRLLVRHRDWAIESGIVSWRTPAHLRLYLLELVGSANRITDERTQQDRQKHLDMAWRHARSDRQKRECRLFQVCEQIITAEKDPFPENVVNEFREALLLHSDSSADKDEDVIQQGVTRLAGVLLRRCPRLHDLLKNKLDPGWFTSPDDFDYWFLRAKKYEGSLKTGRILSPCIDHDKNTVIRRLAQTRLTATVFRQAEETAQQARQLLKQYQANCEAEEGEGFEILKRDVEYAAFMHDWYRGTDPARLLTLASEWNLTISGEEWSNPRLLQGRLASTVLRRMYDAENVLGQSRYQRITNMVDNCVVGREDQTALGRVFYLANFDSERSNAPFAEVTESRDWRHKKHLTLEQAYEEAIEQRKKGVWDLGYVDASEEPASTVIDSQLLIQMYPDEDEVGD